jgi:hypothetical protein
MWTKLKKNPAFISRESSPQVKKHVTQTVEEKYDLPPKGSIHEGENGGRTSPVTRNGTPSAPDVDTKLQSLLNDIEEVPSPSRATLDRFSAILQTLEQEFKERGIKIRHRPLYGAIKNQLSLAFDAIVAGHLKEAADIDERFFELTAANKPAFMEALLALETAAKNEGLLNEQRLNFAFNPCVKKRACG